jgi:hypothetical protein
VESAIVTICWLYQATDVAPQEASPVHHVLPEPKGVHGGALVEEHGAIWAGDLAAERPGHLGPEPEEGRTAEGSTGVCAAGLPELLPMLEQARPAGQERAGR